MQGLSFSAMLPKLLGWASLSLLSVLMYLYTSDRAETRASLQQLHHSMTLILTESARLQTRLDAVETELTRLELRSLSHTQAISVLQAQCP